MPEEPIEPRPDDPIDAAEAARRLGISMTSLYALCKARRLAHHRVGSGKGRGIYVFQPSDVVSYLASCRVEAVPGSG